MSACSKEQVNTRCPWCRAQAANRQGETIYKGHRSYDLMLSLQLGMRHSVGDLSAAPTAQRLAPEHFTQKACPLPY